MNRRSIVIAAAALLLSSNALFGAAAVPAYVSAAVTDPHRPQSDTSRDTDRLPIEMMSFSGIKPGDKIIELIPAGGYSTRLLSALVGPRGHVYSINLPAFADRIKAQIKPVTDEPAYANVTVSEQNLGEMKVPEPVDAVYTAQNYHDFKNPGQFNADTNAMNKAAFAALKPGGLYVIIDHNAAPGSGTRDTGTLHRIDPETVKGEVLAAGFVLDAESTALRNPNDPHTARVDDKTDKMFFRFRKPR
jgi:predicted methyltransferase